MVSQLARGLPLLSALAGCTYAQSTTIDLILPIYSQEVVMGSIVGVEATATTYLLTCPTSVESASCDLGSGIELIEGPSVFEIHMTETGIAYV